MPYTNEIDPLGSFKILLIAENGKGKSVAAGSFKKHKQGRIWVSDFDGRMKPVQYMLPDMKIEYNTILSSVSQAEAAIGFMGFKQFLDKIESMQDRCELDVWVLDSVTSASMTAIIYQLQSKGTMKLNKAGLPVTGWDEINAETVAFTKMLEIACKSMNEKFGTTIIWTCHPVSKTLTEGETTKRYTSIAAYGNKVPSLVPNFFDEIYSITDERSGLEGQRRRYVNTVPTDDFPGKSCLGLPSRIEITNDKRDPNQTFYDKFMEALKGGPK